MLEDVNYSFLKETFPAKYEVMMLRDLYGNTYADIAREEKLSVSRVIQDYHFAKIRQARMYIRHLAIVHEHTNTKFFHDLYTQAEDCYADWQCATAYLEKKYKTILDEYRDGEPGMPVDFLAQLPPFKKRWSKETVQKIITWREAEKKPERKTYAEIGQLLKMTKFKAESLYEHHYHIIFLSLTEQLKKNYGTKFPLFPLRIPHKGKNKGKYIAFHYLRGWKACKIRKVQEISPQIPIFRSLQLPYRS